MIYILPIISAFIGWFTNYIAIKMLFHPKIEKNILGLKIQGIFPKRQKQFAEKLGTLVSKELISFKDIESKIISNLRFNMFEIFFSLKKPRYVNIIWTKIEKIFIKRKYFFC